MPRFAAILAAFLATTSIADAQSQSTAEDVLRQIVGRDPDRALRQFITQLFNMSATGELTPQIAQTIDQRRDARQRMEAISVILMNDLDGDGAVSAEEIARSRRVMAGGERAQLETMVLDVDADRDGALSAAEIAARGAAMVTQSRTSGRRGVMTGADFMMFDADGNGVVDVADIVKTVDRIAAEVPPVTPPLRREPARPCNLPAPSAEAVPVYVGGYEGTAVSTVAVAGLDRETSFATLEIEAGEGPVYIVFSVYDAMVVRVTGATDRVERFVGASLIGKIGVVGLPREVVDLTSLPPCGLRYASGMDTADGVKAKAVLTAKLGREVAMFGSYDLGQVTLPGGTFCAQSSSPQVRMTEQGVKEIVRPNAPAGLNGLFRRFYPDGIASVMPDDVVTNGVAQAYDVLPQQAGLLQLVEGGALSIMSDGTFSIDKPIARFPAGLNGAHSVRFVLRRSVPMPAGSPGHSRVLIEETGECLGDLC